MMRGGNGAVQAEVPRDGGGWIRDADSPVERT